LLCGWSLRVCWLRLPHGTSRADVLCCAGAVPHALAVRPFGPQASLEMAAMGRERGGERQRDELRFESHDSTNGSSKARLGPTALSTCRPLCSATPAT
jgi:hypothetical protein